MLLRVTTQALRYKVVPEGTFDLLEVLGLDGSVGEGVATCTSATLGPNGPPVPLHQATGANDNGDAGLDFLADLYRKERGQREPGTAGRSSRKGNTRDELEEMLEEMMEDLEINWPVEENAAVDAEEEEIHVVAALERADNEAAEASAHQGPAAAYVAGDLAAAAVADPAVVAVEVADVAGGLADVVATEDAPQVYGALKRYSSHKRWWFHDMTTNERALTTYGLAGLKGQGRLWRLWLCGQRRACVRAAKSINKQPNN